jgi:hypothetical protein
MLSMAAVSDSRESELDDLRFAAGSPDNQWQWPPDVLGTRGSIQGQTINARPCLTINKLPQHIKQVTNDQRQNRPSGKVIPVSDDADEDVAEIFDGVIRYIEYISDVDVALDTACENQVTFGEGYYRILTEYCSDDSFEQDIKYARIRNSFSVHMDPNIQDPCGSDAEWCIIAEDISHDEYTRRWPDASPLSSIKSTGVGDNSIAEWFGDDFIRIAEYFYFEHTSKNLNLYPGDHAVMEGSIEDKTLKEHGLTPTRTRKVDVKQVKWIKTNGFDILEEQDWAGKWIPVIRIVGNEVEVDGKLHISGLVRNAKDAQRMYNYWTSQEAEMLALAPKAPFIGYGGQFEGYETQWKTANTTNWPYLEVNPDVTDGQGTALPLPQRSTPPMAQNGLIAAKGGAADDIKSTTGQYDTSLGATSNERSGKAIMAREKQSDTGTYHYVDNLARGVRFGTRQLVDLIPKIYDTKRILRIMGIDGSVDSAQVDPSQEEPIRKMVDETGRTVQKIYNLGVGRYDVRVTTGPSYLTKRQEALQSMSDLLQGNKELWAVAGDLFVKNMDWPGAEELAARLAKTIDPKLLAGDDESPEMMAAQKKMEEMGQEMDQMHQMLININKSVEIQTLRNEHFANDIKAFDAETKRLTALSGTAAAAPVSEDIQEVVKTYIRQILSQETLEEEEPPTLEMEEQHMQQQPPPGMPPQQMPPQGMPPQLPQPPQGM